MKLHMREERIFVESQVKQVSMNNGWSDEYLASATASWLGSKGINDRCSFNRFAEH